MKKHLLFIYPEMMVGGSTTSLLSVLNLIDYNKYEVDIQFQYGAGPLKDYLPKQINILPFAYSQPRQYYKIRKAFSFTSIVKYFKAKKIGGLASAQYMQRDIVKFAVRNPVHYDVAISFLELWSLYYLVDKVNAEKKISWIHVDYKAARLFINLDLKYCYQNCSSILFVDNIVLVSEQCLSNFIKIAPSLITKATKIENILNSDIIRKRSMEALTPQLKKMMDNNKIKFVTVCRISFGDKGLDRGVRAFNILKAEGKLEGVIWYIIGDGPDLNRLRAMIEEYRLEQNIILLGERLNPLNIEKKCDIFFLPSYYEGKPMAVTEAQMLGLVPLITRFSSADEVVDNNINGIICDNSENGILLGLNYAIENIELVRSKYKCNVLNNDYTNVNEFRLIEDLFKSE